MSEAFSVEGRCEKLMALAAIFSLTLWYAITLCFFFDIEDGIVVFNTTLILSPIIKDVFSCAIPSILSLYLTSTTISVPILAATNSHPYDDDSTVFCHFVYQMSGVLLTN